MKSKAFNQFFYQENQKKTIKDYKKLINKACKKGDPKAKKKVNKLMNEENPNPVFIKALTQYQNDIWNQGSELEGSTMIHEKDYVPMNCCLCGAYMETIHDTHNPQPLTPKCYAKEALLDNLPHRCCSKCNHEKVNPARIKGMGTTFNPSIGFEKGAVDKETGFIDLSKMKKIEEEDKDNA